MNLAIGTAASSGAPPIPMVLLMLSLFPLMITFVAVMTWLRQRKKERMSYYRHELERRLVEKGDMTHESLLKMRQTEHRQEWRRRREELKLGGLVTAAMGGGMLIASWQMGERELQVGWIPFAIGLFLFAYGQWFSPEQMNGEGNGEGASS